jgi:hypothetical protein
MNVIMWIRSSSSHVFTIPESYALSFYRSQNVFGLVQNFCTRPKIYLHIVAVTNILCQTKFRKIGFCAGTKVFEEALNAVKFLYWIKKFGPAQNILGPVKGQGIRIYDFVFTKNFLCFVFLQE